MFLKVEITKILLVSEGIFRELTAAAGLCPVPCPHSASLQQTYFVLVCFCTLSQPYDRGRYKCSSRFILPRISRSFG